MKKLILAFVALGLFTTANAAKIESISLPKEVEEHVNYITMNCDVITHLTERIEEDALFGGTHSDSLRNIDRVVRSCDDGTFKASRKAWDAYHAYHVNLENTGQLLPAYTKHKFQAMVFILTGRYMWLPK